MVSTERYDLNTDNTLGGNNPSDLEAPSQKAIKEYVDSQSGGTATDVQINGTSITSNNVANIVTEGTYDESTNKIATMNDVPDAQVNSDWNANSGVAQILNKPTIPTVDQTYDGTSANAQSGVAIEGELTTNYQEKLSSGTNIKTVNNTTLLGSGNIDVQSTITSSNKLSSDLVDDTNNTHKFATSAQLTQIGTNQTDISTINGKIPSQASASNQLADKAFVNSSIQTATANFRGNWADWTSVPTSASSYPVDYAGSTTPTVNDYLVVQDASDYTETTLEGTWRFKYSGTWSTDGKSGWLPEYQVNETPMTSAQLAALNSGITASKVEEIDDKQRVLVAGDSISLESIYAWKSPTQVSNLGNHTWIVMAHDGGGNIVAIGLNGYVSTSNDGGDTWTQATQPSTIQGITWDGIFYEYSSSKFILLGRISGGGTDTSYISTSSDNGSTWSIPVTVSNLQGKRYRGITYDGTTYYALSSDGYLSTSTNGTTWTSAQRKITVNYTWATLAYNVSNSTFVAIASNSRAVAISTNSGSTWATHTIDNFANNNIQALTVPVRNNQTEFVALSTAGNMFISADGSTWSSAINTGLSGHVWRSLVWTGRLVALSSDGYVSNSITGDLISVTDIKTINGTSLLGSGDIDTSEIFLAVQGTTTFSQISTAYNSGKTILLKDENNYIGYLLRLISGAEADFLVGSNTLVCVDDLNQWTFISNYLDIPDTTNLVTTNTDQTISNRKTFLGEKAIYFKQNATTNKLGFTLFNPSDTELGALEYRPNTVGGSALLSLNTQYSNSCYVGFRYWGNMVNIVAPKPTTIGSYYIPINITDGTNTATADNTGTVDITTIMDEYTSAEIQTLWGSI